MQLREHGSRAFSPATHSLVTAAGPQPVFPAPPTPQVNAGGPDLSLHNQDLVDVMAELERVENTRAEFAFGMVSNGQVHPLHDGELKSLRKEKEDTPYDPCEWASPILSGTELSPFRSIPSAARVEAVIKYDIGGDNFFRFAPSRGSPDQDADAIIQLLDNISNPRYSNPGAVIHMQSPTFDRYRQDITGWDSDGMLGHSSFQMTIAPANEIFELEYYEHYFSSTLFTGSKVWFAFPPLDGNLSLLRQAYDGIQTTGLSRIPLDILVKMQHGIAIIQKAGQTLLMPPFWPVMTFCTETSTSAGFFVATAAQFMQRAKHIDLWMSVNLLWDTLDQQQSHLVHYATEFANHFATILAGKFKRFKAAPLINQICQEWVKTNPKDPEYENMKDKVTSLCSLIQNQQEAQRIAQTIQQAWIKFLEEKHKKKLECRLCHVRIERLPGTGTQSQRLAQHVLEEHCNFWQ
jgi:hypothetical protein